ncbi:MAG TPA: hypothetical protein VGH85_07785 [Mycobacteriales bacterium]
MRPEMVLWSIRMWASGVFDTVRRDDAERGDVPGWVMVTLMSAILVVAILVPFRDAVIPAVKGAIQNVIDAGK